MSEKAEIIVALTGVAVVGVVGWMLITGKGFKGLIEDSVGGALNGIGAAVKDGIYNIDPENKTGKFFTDVGNASYVRGTGTIPPLTACQKGWQEAPLTCRKPFSIVNGKLTGGQIVGRYNDPSCGDTLEKQAGLCYKLCATGYHGVASVCWKNEFGETKTDPARLATLKLLKK